MSVEHIEKMREAMREVLTDRILVVEDDPEDMELFYRTMANTHIGVCMVSSYREAVAKLSRETYTLCLLDLKLPDGPRDPVELVNTLLRVNPKTPIAILTGTLHDPDLRQLLEKKVSAVLLKPLTYEQIKDVFNHE